MRQGLGFIGNQAVAAGNDRDLGLDGELAGFVLVAELAHRFFGGADEFDLASAANLGEVSVFGKKAIARMDRLHIGDLGGADDARDLEIAFGGDGRADADRLIGELAGTAHRGRPR